MVAKSDCAERGMRRHLFSRVGRLLVLEIFLIAAGCFSGYSQVSYDTATLKGTIYDQKGAVVPGATVTVTNPDTGLTKQQKAEADGTYQIPALPPGTYQVSAEVQGFSKAVANNLVLTVGQAEVYDFHLTVGQLSQVIEVTGQPFVIAPEQTQQANTINNRQVENLPNVTRTFTQSIYTLPGVVNSNAPSLQDPGVGTGYLSSGFSIGGSTGRGNLFTIDGGENDYGSGALRVLNVPMDSIQEFQVNRNSFAAEFGYTSGTAINIVTKSGTNKFHGSADLYFHNQHTDAINFFNKLIEPGARPYEQSVIWGGMLGGPIKKDKLFFFASFEHQKLDQTYFQNLSGQSAFQGPTAAQASYLAGLAATGPLGARAAADLTANLNPFNTTTSAFARQAGLLQALVTPNEGAFNGYISLLGAARGIPGYNSPQGRNNNWVSRLDWLPNSNNSVSLRFGYMHEIDLVTPPPPASTYDRRQDATVTASWNHVFSPAMVNTVRVQVVPVNTADVLAPQPGHSEIDLLSASQITLGTPFPFPYHAYWKRFQFEESLSWVRGGHTVKFGASYRPDYYNVTQELWFGGQWQFADGTFPLIELAATPLDQFALASYNTALGLNPILGSAATNLTAAQSYLAGTPLVYMQANNNGRWAAWDNYVGFYAQDSWKVSPRFTLDYGVRFDFEKAPSPVPQSFRVSPRLGLAWDPAGNGKTVIRAGGGLFVAPVLFLVPFYVNVLGDSGKYINQGALIPTITYPPGTPLAGMPIINELWAIQSANASLANPNPQLSSAQLAGAGFAIGPPGPTAFGNSIFTLGQNFKPAYSIQASASVARELAPDLSLEIGYVMYRGVHIQQNFEANYQETGVIDPFIGPFYTARPGTTAGQPNAFIFQNNAYSSIGTSLYNGMTVSLTKRFSRGLQFQVNYTFSKAEDDTSDYSSLSTPFRPLRLYADWSLSNFDQRHNFVANAVYTTPFPAGTGNWWARSLADVSISPIVSARSGIPYTLLVPGLSNGTVGHNQNARPWHEGRNVDIGPGFASWDMRISKAFYVNRESGMRFDCIAQATNILNHVNFSVVNNNFPALPNYVLPNGGTLLNGPYNVSGFVPQSVAQLSAPLAFSSAYPPRQISFGLQFSF